MSFEGLVGGTVRLFEGGAAVCMLGGALLAMVMAVRERKAGGRVVFRRFRQRVGRAIILGLELLVAGDILRTLTETPTLTQLAGLAVIVAIRTFLSFTLAVELEGRWPWQPKRPEAAPEAR